jgi:hypothetical protein
MNTNEQLCTRGSLYHSISSLLGNHLYKWFFQRKHSTLQLNFELVSWVNCVILHLGLKTFKGAISCGTEKDKKWGHEKKNYKERSRFSHERESLTFDLLLQLDPSLRGWRLRSGNKFNVTIPLFKSLFFSSDRLKSIRNRKEEREREREKERVIDIFISMRLDF